MNQDEFFQRLQAIEDKLLKAKTEYHNDKTVRERKVFLSMSMDYLESEKIKLSEFYKFYGKTP